ncbi:MAG: phosphoenolpyruvate--protein phosphotransferase [Devosia sp.]
MPLRVTGTVASIGYAAGLLHIIARGRAAYQPSNDPSIEAERLREAVTVAYTEVADLMDAAQGDAAAILEFQVAMLGDESLSDPAIELIGQGTDAATAWRSTLDEQIAGYDEADDAYFRARGADLRDIRDRVLGALTGETRATLPSGAVIHAEDLTPSEFLSMDWKKGGGIILREGSAASHVAMLARARGVPMLVSTPLDAANDDFVLLDAERGAVTVSPDAAERDAFLAAATAHVETLRRAREEMGKPAVTIDGVPVEVLVNIAEPSDTDSIDIAACGGVGLMRTEFLFSNGLPDEETQLAAYRRVLQWAGDKPVTIRTVDAGGDKPVPGFTVEESNPFLGLRGIRLSLAKPDIFRVQVRALLRAASSGNLKVMFPMISVPAEYAAARAMFEQEAATLGLSVPPLGIIVDVPAVAVHPAPFRDVAFFSIGSNDLTQYVMAAGRDNGAVAALADPRNPAVLGLIHNVAAFGEANGIPVSLCGDAGGDPQTIPSLIAAGLRALSVSPAQMPLAKAAVATSSVAHA